MEVSKLRVTKLRWESPTAHKKSKVKPLDRPKWPMGLTLKSCFLSMKQLGVLLLPPGWDGSPSQGYPHHICWYPFVHLGEEKHCESQWALTKAPNCKKFISRQRNQNSSHESCQMQEVCWKIGESWALRRAFEWKKFVGQLSQWTLIRASDCTKFVGWWGS